MYAVVVILLFIAALAYFWLVREGLLSHPAAKVAAGLLLLLAIGLRYPAMGHATPDYEIFLSVWVQHFRDNGGFAALADPIGNYNLPYLYFLALFSYIPIDDLYLIKLLSILFDMILAWYAMRILGLYTSSAAKRLFTFFLVLFLPTVFLNGAVWGQCDSIYAAFALMALYYAMKGDGLYACIFVSLSLAFKLQAIFILPAFLLFLLSGRVRLWHLLACPLTYLLCILPAVMLGHSFSSAILFYVNTAGTAGSGLNYNSPSLFAFLSGGTQDAMLGKVGIAAAFLLVILIYAGLWKQRKSLSNETLLAASLLFVVGIPLLLPHMHDRYFFLADVLAVPFGLSRLRRMPVPVLIQFASLLGYHAYLLQRYLLPMKYGAAALVLAAALLILELRGQEKGAFRGSRHA